MGEDLGLSEQLRERQLEAPCRLADGREHRLLEERRRRRDLCSRFPTVVVEHYAVRERAAAVDGDDVAQRAASARPAPYAAEGATACTHASLSSASSSTGSAGRAISVSSSVKQSGQ